MNLREEILKDSGCLNESISLDKEEREILDAARENCKKLSIGEIIKVIKQITHKKQNGDITYGPLDKLPYDWYQVAAMMERYKREIEHIKYFKAEDFLRDGVSPGQFIRTTRAKIKGKKYL